MFAHVSIGVKNIHASIAFYDAVINALGYGRLFGNEEEGFMAYGPEDSFFIINTPLDESRDASACNGSHICLKAKDKNAVDAFYNTAIKMGAKDGGAPGLRPHYSEDYYAAFIFDLDGHKIEAMARVPN
jgi:catechol 2,3-dioxygenase-like lactoylglutathione lyase family enzyme